MGMKLVERYSRKEITNYMVETQERATSNLNHIPKVVQPKHERYSMGSQVDRT